MAVELAIALGALAARAAVAQLIQGQPMDNAAWAGVATQVVDVLVSTSTRQESDLQQLGQKFDVLGQKIDRVGNQVGEIPGREFEEYMAAGRRYVRDLPDAWRTEKDRHKLIRDARREFVHAFGIAEHMGSPHRMALADVAIAGCWLWVPSLNDVRKTIGAARQILEKEMLYGTTLPTKSYADVLYLCRAYGEQPARAVNPVLPVPGRPPTELARLAVRAEHGRWVACAGVDVRIEPLADAPAEPLRAASPLPLIPNPQPLARFPRNPQYPRFTQNAPQPLGRFPRTSRTPVFFNPQTPARVPRIPQAPVPPPRKRVRVHVRNNRAEWIAISITSAAVIAQLPGAGNTLPAANRVKPGKSVTLDLTRPQPPVAELVLRAPRFQIVPQLPNIGFVLP